MQKNTGKSEKNKNKFPKSQHRSVNAVHLPLYFHLNLPANHQEMEEKYLQK